MLYDQGVGIPSTLPKNYSMEMINSALSLLKIIQPQDGEMIQAAMQIGRSRTRLVHRGKGLADLRGFVERAGSGSLRILSGKGYYEYFADGREKVQNMGASLGGTLIQWRVPLSAISLLGDRMEL
jgi:hypothetical protein